MSKNHGSAHANRHPYQRPEMWISELVFWNTPYHKPGAYDEFHQRQINEAGRMNKQRPQNNSYYKVRAVEKVEKPKEEPKEEVPYTGETKKCRKCGFDQPISFFAIVHQESKYKKKDGTVNVYSTTTVRHVCKKCINKGPRGKEGQQFVIGGIRIY